MIVYYNCFLDCWLYLCFMSAMYSQEPVEEEAVQAAEEAKPKEAPKKKKVNSYK